MGGPKLARGDQFWLPKLVRGDWFWRWTDFFVTGQRAAEYGTTAVIKFFAKKYPELSLKETTVRCLKNQYQDELHLRQGVPGFKSNLQMDGIHQSFFRQTSL